MEKQRKQGNLKIKNSKGITLVALVVTIIIMLILAGVALRLALGENGLFKMSEKAVEKYKEEAGKEENALQKGSEEIGNIIESLKPPVVIDGGEVGSHLNEYQGKYVDIGLNTNGNEVTTDDWELFYAGNGRIYLIAADYVKADKLTEWGIIGENGTLKGVGFSIDSFYHTYAFWSSGSLKFFDLPTTPNNYIDLVMHTGYDLTKNQDNNNSKVVSQLLNKDAWNGIKETAGKKNYIDFAIGSPTLEMWCAAWNEAIKGDENGFVTLEPDPQTSSYGYKVKHDTTSGTTMYMDGKTSSTLSSDQKTALETTYKTFFTGNYWLASPSASNYRNLMSILSYSGGYRICNGNYASGNGSYNALRPVVCLQSGVKLQKNETKSNEEKTIYDVIK